MDVLQSEPPEVDPPGKDNSRQRIDFTPVVVISISRDPVNVGGFEDWTTVGSPPGLPPMLIS